jgi:hypothetical protein
MQTRQWMVTHEWMIKPMPQREWIERRGMMVWIAEVFTSLGTGLYLVALFMNNWWGMAVGWGIIMFLKLPVHLAYFGKPLRFYRTIPPFSNAWHYFLQQLRYCAAGRPQPVFRFCSVPGSG